MDFQVVKAKGLCDFKCEQCKMNVPGGCVAEDEIDKQEKIKRPSGGLKHGNGK